VGRTCHFKQYLENDLHIGIGLENRILLDLPATILSTGGSVLSSWEDSVGKAPRDCEERCLRDPALRRAISAQHTALAELARRSGLDLH
jgi:hypothetical protein